MTAVPGARARAEPQGRRRAEQGAGGQASRPHSPGRAAARSGNTGVPLPVRGEGPVLAFPRAGGAPAGAERGVGRVGEQDGAAPAELTWYLGKTGYQQRGRGDLPSLDL